MFIPFDRKFNADHFLEENHALKSHISEDNECLKCCQVKPFPKIKPIILTIILTAGIINELHIHTTKEKHIYSN